MARTIDTVIIKGRILQVNPYDIRIYVYAEYRKALEKYVGSEVEAVVFIKGEES